MSKRKVVWSVAMVGVLAVVGVGLALAQQGGGPGGGAGGGGIQGGGAGGRFDPAQMRQRYLERIKEQLQVTDEEWTVLEPRLEKVTTLSREAGGLGGGRMFGRQGGRQGGPGGGPTPAGPPPPGAPVAGAAAPAQPQSAVAKATEDLQTTLDNNEAKPEQIKAKLTALREAREKAKQELAKARESVRELVTQRQEAQLVLMGILD